MKPGCVGNRNNRQLFGPNRPHKSMVNGSDTDAAIQLITGLHLSFAATLIVPLAACPAAAVTDSCNRYAFWFWFWIWFTDCSGAWCCSVFVSLAWQVAAKGCQLGQAPCSFYRTFHINEWFIKQLCVYCNNSTANWLIGQGISTNSWESMASKHGCAKSLFNSLTGHWIH